MSPLDALWHLLNLFLPALGSALIAAALAKLALARANWRRVPLVAAGAAGPPAPASLALLAGLVVFGRDGRWPPTRAMVVACALALWWAGFAPRR